MRAAMLLLIVLSQTIYAQNVGIGTTSPQRKLHVAGGLRVDTLAAPDGILRNNANGDVSSLPFTNNPNHALLATGAFGAVPGTIVPGALVASQTHTNPALIAAGFSLIGELENGSLYHTQNMTFPANAYEPIYSRGVAEKLSPPNFGYGHGSGWTGSLLYYFHLNTFTYDPVTDIWTNVSPTGFASGLPVWTGTEFLVMDYTFLEMKKFNVTTNTWSATSTVNKPANRTYFSVAWTGNRLIVWGGEVNGSATNSGGMYDPVTDTWTTMSTVGAPSARLMASAIWNTATNRVIVWGGSSSLYTNETNTGAFFDPVTNTWTGATSTVNAPVARYLHAAIWTGTEMIVHGGRALLGALNTGARFNPASNTWTTMAASPYSTYSHAIGSVGSNIYVSGGFDNQGTPSILIYRYNTTTNAWSYVTAMDSPKTDHYIFTNNTFVLFWGSNRTPLNPNTGTRLFLQSIASSSTVLTPQIYYLYRKN